MKFTLALKHNWLLQKFPWTKFWVVKESFFWYIDYQNKKGKIIIPEWFVTDMWSIPRFLWIFFDKSKYISYILHDYNYKIGKYTRKQCDLMLLEWLHIENASFIERTLIYIGVRIGWALFYKN